MIWRLLRAVLALSPLLLVSCAAGVPWPPRPGSCIEARLGRPTTYRLNHNPASRDEIERAVSSSSPARRAAVERSRTGDHVLVGLAVGGFSMGAAGVFTAAVTEKPIFLLLSTAIIPAFVTAVLLQPQEPFHRAVNDYNAEIDRTGGCGDDGWRPGERIGPF